LIIVIFLLSALKNPPRNIVKFRDGFIFPSISG